MRQSFRTVMLAAVAALVAACAKPPGTEAPLAYVPEDTPYVYANLDPVPTAVTERWTRPMQEYWPAAIALYEALLQDPKLAFGVRTRRIASALLDELKSHADWNRLREIGLKPDARVAFYGVGLVPVLRFELGDSARLRAEIARIEEKAGERLPVAKTGELEYWQVGNQGLAAAIAIEGSQLVVTMVPAGAGDALKQQLLGVTRPARSLAASGALEALAKQYGWSRHGGGYLDIVRIVERLSKPLEGSDAEFAQALGLPAIAPGDEACRREYVEIAKKFPRLVAGAEELSEQRMRIGSQLEIEPGLAGRIAAALDPAPGSSAPFEGAIDVSLALPVLKLKAFWVAQADAVAARPYACASLQELNQGFAASKAKVDVTVPPPFSDLTGVRVSVTKFDLGTAGGVPDSAGKLLIATSNPAAAFAMAQLTVPGLQNLKLAADGKPVALPPDLLPGVPMPPTSVAMSAKAIAFATGADQADSLTALLDAPAAGTPDFLRLHIGGSVYGWMARSFETMKAALPAESRKNVDQQIAMFRLYEKWLRSNDVVLTATPGGIRLRQTVELNAP